MLARQSETWVPDRKRTGMARSSIKYWTRWNAIGSRGFLTTAGGDEVLLARLEDLKARGAGARLGGATFEALEIPVVGVTGLIAKVLTKEVEIAEIARSDLFAGGRVIVQEIDVPEDFTTRAVVDLSLPQDALLVTVVRGDDVSLARGDTVVQGGDRILAASTIDNAAAVVAAFEVERKGS